MQTSVIIDLVIGGVFVLCVILGYRRGLFRSLAELAVVILALILSYQCADLAAPLVIDRGLRPATHKAIEQRVDEMMSENLTGTSQLEEMERVVEAIPNDFIREQAEKLLEGMGLSVETSVSCSARETLLALGYQLADTVLDTVVYSMLHTLLYLASFLLLTAALRLIVQFLDLTFRLPLLHQVNKAGGLIFGAAKGLVLVCLGVWLLGSLGWIVTPEVIDRSWLLKLVAGWMGVAGGTAF